MAPQFDFPAMVRLGNILATADKGKLSIWLTNLIKPAKNTGVDGEKYEQKMFKVEDAPTILDSQESLKASQFAGKQAKVAGV